MTFTHFGEDPTAASGEIVMWAGKLSNIPSGWVLCDGNNGTPNLTARFLKGVNGSNPGTTGGQDSFTLSSSHLPSHGHTISMDGSGGHDHTVYYDTDDDIPYDSTGGSRYPADGSNTHDTVSKNGAHSHTIQNVTNTGSGNSIDNRPAYYALAFIMKA